MAEKEAITFKLEGEMVATVILEVDTVRFPAVTLDDLSRVIIDSISDQVLLSLEARHAVMTNKVN